LIAIDKIIELLRLLGAQQTALLHLTWTRVRKLPGFRRCPPTYRAIGEAIRHMASGQRLPELLPPGCGEAWYAAFRRSVEAEGRLVDATTPPQAMTGRQPPGFEQSIVSIHRKCYLHALYLQLKVQCLAKLFLERHGVACKPTLGAVLQHLRQHRTGKKRDREEDPEMRVSFTPSLA